MDNDELTGLVFVDFHKAFDILDHNLLLMKSSVYGASPDSVAWFQSYLAGWWQFVKLGYIPSQPKPVRQEGTAGINPRSFFISRICEWYAFTFEQLHHDIYADDTTLSLSANWNNITSLT